MGELRTRVAKISLGFSLVLVFLLSGFVLAHQCQANASINSATSAINILHSHNVNPLDSSFGGSPHLITDVCVGITFLVLLAGRKLFLHQRKFGYNYRFKLTTFLALKFTHHPNLLFTLSRPQLGVFRI